MKLLYYPGCTVKTTGAPYEKAAIGVLKEFNIEVVEMSRWVCCGAYPGLSRDVNYHLVAPIRNLIYAQEELRERGINNNYLLTLCSMCFNTLKSANQRYLDDEDARKTLGYFFDTEPYYEGGIKIIHFLEVIRDIIGLKNLSKHVERKLSINIAPFYGCYLLRPRGIGIDDPESPNIIEGIIEALGGKPVDYPYKNRCCGGYLVTKKPEIVWERVKVIVRSAVNNNADIIVTTCPLCLFNLEEGQKRAKNELQKTVPIFYEPELIAYAMGKTEYLLPERLDILKKVVSEHK